MVFLDGSVANEHTRDRKCGYFPVGILCIELQPQQCDEKWSVFPIYGVIRKVLSHCFPYLLFAVRLFVFNLQEYLATYSYGSI